jgi:hypothetical protein
MASHLTGVASDTGTEIDQHAETSHAALLMKK